MFGDWGEGKSHFLGQLRSQIHERSGQVAADDELTHRAVRQVWFNAWHYAETDLWASLVSELFSQLAAPPGPEVSRAEEQRRQSRSTTWWSRSRRARRISRGDGIGAEGSEGQQHRAGA